MKKLFPVLFLVLLLTGCTKAPEHSKIAALYQNARELSAQTNIVAQSDVLVEYDLSYKLSGGVAEVTILRPDVLEGVTAQLSPGSANISFDGVSAETLLPGIPGFTPIDAFHGMLSDLCAGVPIDMSVSKQTFILTYSSEYQNIPLEKRVTLNADSFAVTSCEFFVDGRMVMRMEVTALNIFN